MHFLTQIEHHLKDFDTTARAEIERFLEHLKSKFVEPGAPVPSAVAEPVAPPVVEPVDPPVVEPVAPPVTEPVAKTVDTGAVV